MSTRGVTPFASLTSEHRCARISTCPTTTMRRTVFPHLLTVLNVLVFLGFGVAFLVDPQMFFDEVDLVLTPPAALLEIRAMYGGMQIGVAAFVASSLFGVVPRRDAILLSGLALAGLAGVRGIGMVTMGVYGVHVQLFSPEAVGAAINLLAYVRLRSEPS